MKKSEKQMVSILIIVAVIIIGIIYFATRQENEVKTNAGEQETENKVVEEFVQVLDDGTKLNTSTKLQQTKNIEGLDVGNIQLTHSNGLSVVLADVVNNSSKATDLMVVTLTLLDKNGNELEKIDGLISPLQPGASTQLNMGVTADHANAYDFTIVKK